MTVPFNSPVRRASVNKRDCKQSSSKCRSIYGSIGCRLQESLQAVAGGAVVQDLAHLFDDGGAGFERRQAAGVDVRDDGILEADRRVAADAGGLFSDRWVGEAVDQVGRQAARCQRVAAGAFTDEIDEVRVEAPMKGTMSTNQLLRPGSVAAKLS